MIRNRTRRMTVAQLKERMDARFERLSARMEARFDSLNEKIDAVVRITDDKYRHHDQVLHEHEQRIKDLERPANA